MNHTRGRCAAGWSLVVALVLSTSAALSGSALAAEPSALATAAPSALAGSHSAAPASAAPVQLQLQAVPQTAVVGQPAAISIANAPAGSADVVWQLPGATPAVQSTGATTVIHVPFVTAGTQEISVQLSAGGQQLHGTMALTVAPAPAASSASGASTTTTATTSVSSTAARTTSATTTSTTTDAVRQVAHAASDPGVNIVDFAFSPTSITIHVGDTVTWTNTGSQPHSATATDHSFDTGILSKGQSGSHTFTTAGTFSYFCTVHPFMKATIVVGSSSSGSGSGTSSTTGSNSSGAGTTSSTASTTAANPASAAGSTGPNLPYTGMDVGIAALLGLGLLSSGLGVRLLWAHD